MAINRATPFDWLKDTPPNDCNFVNALKQATVDELRSAIEYREPKPKNATAVKVLRAELKRRIKQGGKE